MAGEYGKLMKTFTMYRLAVPDTHNDKQANPPDEPQFEGVVFEDGRCVVRWLTAVGSVSIWDCFDDMMTIHGHPEYQSEIVWHAEKNFGHSVSVTEKET